MINDVYDEPEEEPLDDSIKSRRPRGWLAMDINRVIIMWTTGEAQLKQYALMTPYNAAKLLREIDGLDKSDTPSSGAVADVFKKWEEMGYALCAQNPYCFIDYTDLGREIGMAECELRYKRKKALTEAEEALEEAEHEEKRMELQLVIKKELYKDSTTGQTVT